VALRCVAAAKRLEPSVEGEELLMSGGLGAA
jgi:hypothetical protein